MVGTDTVFPEVLVVSDKICKSSKTRQEVVLKVDLLLLDVVVCSTSKADSIEFLTLQGERTNSTMSALARQVTKSRFIILYPFTLQR